MSVDKDVNIPEILSVTQMARLLNLSRSRLYQLVSENIFLPPIYNDSKRPYFTSDMAIKNLEAKKNNVGINGKVVLFYTSRNSSVPYVHKKKSHRNKSNNIPTGDNHQNLKEGLSGSTCC